MSELKSYKMVDEKYCADCVCVISSEVYLKSEADKVIALLKDKANYNECAYKLKSEELADTCRFYEEEARHHKHKRCLNMASNCRLRGRLFGACGLYEKELWALKWHRRWLELAEKFKDAK